MNRKTFLLCASVTLGFFLILVVVFCTLLGKPEQAMPDDMVAFVGRLRTTQDIDEINKMLGMRPINPPPGWQPWNKSPEDVRIIVLGDSFTLGWGVGNNETFPVILQGLLRHNLSENLTVINLAVGGAGTQNEYELYNDIGTHFHPDLVILAFNINDWDDSRVTNSRNTTLGGLRAGLLASKVGWMHGLGLRIQSLEQEKRSSALSQVEKWSLIERPLKDIIKSTPPGCFVFVHDFYSSEYLPPPDWRERIDALHVTYGAHVLSLSPFYDAHSPEEVTLPDDYHPNAFAHAQVAALIADYLLNSSMRLECLSK